MKTIKELINENTVSSVLLNGLIEVASEVLDVSVESESFDENEERYEVFDRLYGYLAYDIIENDFVLTQLGIDGTSDLIEFYDEMNSI